MKLTDAQQAEIGLQPEPGVYANVPFADYLLWPYLSKSSLTDYLISPAHHRAVVAGELPRSTSQHYVLGSAVDLAFVEQRGLGAARIFIDAADLQTHRKKWGLARLGAMVDALEAHDRAVELRDSSSAQLSLVWDCPTTGLRRKGRPDLIDFSRGIVTDLKTARDIRDQGFSKACADYNYHWQIQGYRQALLELGFDLDWQGMFILVRNEPIHGVTVRRMAPAALHFAELELELVLARYAQNVIDNQWPAGELVEHDLDLPRWRYQRKGI